MNIDNFIGYLCAAGLAIVGTAFIAETVTEKATIASCQKTGVATLQGVIVVCRVPGEVK